MQGETSAFEPPSSPAQFPQPQLSAYVDISTSFSIGNEELDCATVFSRSDLLRLVLDLPSDAGPVDGDDESKGGSTASSPRPTMGASGVTLWTKLFVPLCLMASKLARRSDSGVGLPSEREPALQAAPEPGAQTDPVYDGMSDKDVAILGMHM